MNLILFLFVILFIISYKIKELNIIENHKNLNDISFNIELKNPTYLNLGLSSNNHDNLKLLTEISKYVYINYNNYDQNTNILHDLNEGILDIGICYERKNYPKNIRFVSTFIHEYFIIISDTNIKDLNQVLNKKSVIIGIQNEEPILTKLYVKLLEFYNIVENEYVSIIKDSVNNLFNKFNNNQINLVCLISSDKNIYLKNLLKFKNYNILPIKNKIFKKIHGPLFYDTIRHINIKNNDFTLTPTISIRKLILTNKYTSLDSVYNLLNEMHINSYKINKNMKEYVNNNYKKYIDLKIMSFCFQDLDIHEGAIEYYKKKGLIKNEIFDIRKIYWKHKMD
jgi:TRAP-type uncharacterized transport system substrate-binding protein